MTDPGRRTGYNAAAAAVTAGTAPAETLNLYACSAHGCPITGTITYENRRVCFVHFRVRETALWDETTARIRNRPAMVEAWRTLRRQVIDEVALDHADRLVPALGLAATGSRYRALARLEHAIYDECLPAEELGTPRTPDGDPRSASELLRRVTAEHWQARALQQRQPPPPAHREPGEEG
jgi:hypothetical protein